MSAALLGAGFRANMGTCVRKLVWLKLIDACDDDGTRIFPAIATVARAAQCSDRQVQRELRAFLDAGLLRLVREGGRGPGNTNEYALDLDVLAAISKLGWDAYVAGRAAAQAGDRMSGGDAAKGDTVSPLDQPEKGDSGDPERVTSDPDKGDTRSHPTPPDINPSREDPSVERERGREEGEDRKSVMRAFERAWQAWPTSVSDSRPEAEKAWLRLTPDERLLAAAEAARYAEACKATGRSKVVSHGVYLREKRWTQLPPAEPAKAEDERIVAPPFGPVWGALRMRELLAGAVEVGASPMTRERRQATFEAMAGMLGREAAERNYVAMGHGIDAEGRLTFPDDFEARMDREHRAKHGFPQIRPLDQAAESGRPMHVRQAYAALVDLMEPVPVAGERFDWWRAEHARRGWPFVPDPGGQPVVFFPRDIGALSRALDALRQGTAGTVASVRGDGDDGDRQG